MFRGGFIYGMLQRWPTEQVLRFANAAAAVSYAARRAPAGVPDLRDVEALLQASGEGLAGVAEEALGSRRDPPVRRWGRRPGRTAVDDKAERRGCWRLPRPCRSR